MYNKMICILCGIGIMLFSCSNDGVFDEESDIFSQPQLHFSASDKWISSAVNSVYFEDEYHLFYQYVNKNEDRHLRHWGHAISQDLCHWQHLNTALLPDELGEIYSGSVVVDWENTTGFSDTGEPPLVAVFTYNHPEKKQCQALAYSLDKGRNWTKYENNPVLNNTGVEKFHDPKVLWDDDEDQWLMVIAAVDQLLFYGSQDLKNWKYLSAFGKNKGAKGGAWECPDLFPVFVPETGDKRWVLLSSIHDGAPNGGSGTQYFIGEFKNNRFRLDQEFAPFLKSRNGEERAVWLDYGRDFHAAVSWSNLPEEDDRQLMIGWMNNHNYALKIPTKSWKGVLTMPRTIALHSTAKGPRVFQAFPIELEKMRKPQEEIPIPAPFSGSLKLDCDPKKLEILLDAGVAQDSNTIIGFKLSNGDEAIYTFGFDASKDQYFSDRTKIGSKEFSKDFASTIHYAPKQLEGALISMHIVLDANSCELIADDGLTVLTDQFFPDKTFTKIEFFVNGASVDIQQLDVFELNSIWE